MADEESKLFSLREAETLRAQIEPILIEAIESRRKLGEVEEQLNALSERTSSALAVCRVPYEKAAMAAN